MKAGRDSSPLDTPALKVREVSGSTPFLPRFIPKPCEHIGLMRWIDTLSGGCVLDGISGRGRHGLELLRIHIIEIVPDKVAFGRILRTFEAPCPVACCT